MTLLLFAILQSVCIGWVYGKNNTNMLVKSAEVTVVVSGTPEGLLCMIMKHKVKCVL